MLEVLSCKVFLNPHFRFQRSREATKPTFDSLRADLTAPIFIKSCLEGHFILKNISDIFDKNE